MKMIISEKPIRLRACLFFIFLWMISLAAWALSPMHSYHDLVAGEGTAGWEDGPFYSALFHTPQGMAINQEGTRLYVADRDNNCVRVVDLSRENQVSTLTGSPKPGFADGPLSSALFNQPAGLLCLPNDQIAVDDEGNSRIRLIDLKSGTVSTLAGNGTDGINDGAGTQARVGLVWNMVYFPERNGIIFSQPELGTLRKVDLKTKQVTTFFRDRKDVPRPGALCVADHKLYLAGRYQDQVYELAPKEKYEKEDGDSFTWREFAKGVKIQSLAWSGKVLYAVQLGEKAPLARLTPEYQPVTFVSLWGDTFKDPKHEAFLVDNEGPYPLGMVADPLSERKLYLSHPLLHLVTSYRDLYQQEYKYSESINPDYLTDFRYPAAKPSRTFRILMIGDSRTFHFYPEEVARKGWENYNRFAVLPKRLEESLNTLAALEDLPVHFEVLHHGEVSGEPLNLWPYYMVPDLAKKFDIDLVLFMLSPNDDGSSLETFFQRPLNAQGVPARFVDAEYLLKPFQERIPPGPPKEFYDLCAAGNKVSLSPSHQILIPNLL